MRALDYPRDRLDLQFLLEPDDEVTHEALSNADLMTGCASPWLPPAFELNHEFATPLQSSR